MSFRESVYNHTGMWHPLDIRACLAKRLPNHLHLQSSTLVASNANSFLTQMIVKWLGIYDSYSALQLFIRIFFCHCAESSFFRLLLPSLQIKVFGEKFVEHCHCPTELSQTSWERLGFRSQCWVYNSMNLSTAPVHKVAFSTSVEHHVLMVWDHCKCSLWFPFCCIGIARIGDYSPASLVQRNALDLQL